MHLNQYWVNIAMIDGLQLRLFPQDQKWLYSFILMIRLAAKVLSCDMNQVRILTQNL